MASIPELPQPGVEVFQEFSTVSPSTIVPTLVPNIVGVCKEIRELYNSDLTLNSDIIVRGPAIATATIDDDPKYNLANKVLSLRVKGGVEQSFTFPGTAAAMSAQDAASFINTHTPAPQGFAAYVYEDDTTPTPNMYLQLRTSGAGGETDAIQVTHDDAVPVFGWGYGEYFYGLGNYIQDRVYLKQESFPDPRSNLEELNIEEDSIRVFFDLSTEVREILRTESYLRRGAAIAAVDDNDGDQLTPYVAMAGEDFKALPTQAIVDASVDLNVARQEINQQLLAMQVDGGGKQFVKFYGIGIISLDISAAFAAITGNDLELIVNGTTVLISTIVAADIDALVIEVNAATVAATGGSVVYRSDVDGAVNVAGDFITFLYGAVPTAIDQDSTVVVNDANTTVALETAMFGVGVLPYEQPLWGDHTTVNGGALAGGPFESHDIEAQIDAAFGATVASIEASPPPTNHLRFTSLRTGEADSKVEILPNPDSTTTCLVALGLTAGITYGSPFRTRVGDDVYADGALIGMIVEVHPGAITSRLKLDREVSTQLSVFDPSSWYIVAKNLDAVVSSGWGVVVPRPDLIIDSNGDVIVKHDFLRDTTGAPVAVTAVPMYCMYTALRLDVTGEAENPALLSFSTTTELDAALDPVSPDNPLSYGLFCAIGNANGVSCTGVGVDEATEDKPYGTLMGFNKAFEFLKSQEVYAVAPMTSDMDVALAARSHANTMSDPEMKGERVAVVHLGTPTRKVDTIVVSGNDGDSVAGGPPYWFDTKISTLSQALLALGVNPTSSFTAAEGVFLDLGTDDKIYNVIGPVQNGTEVKLNFGFSPGQNDDAFYTEDDSDWTGQLPIVSASFSVNIRGAAVANKDEEIEAIYYRGHGISDRRLWIQQLGQLRATVNSIEQLVAGFYMNAAKAGMVGGLPPQQPLTNYPISVFLGVTDTKDRYSTVQLNQGAAGGADWVIQPGVGAPLVSRHQVTTDLTSIEKREQSIVKAIDFCAKFLRGGLNSYVGRYNITPSYLDTLSTVVQGFLRWLVEEGGVVMAANLNNLVQSEDSPDVVIIDTSLEVFYPSNYLRLTIIV
jgi:hypothetical protein